jgi:hypothetical protein
VVSQNVAPPAITTTASAPPISIVRFDGIEPASRQSTTEVTVTSFDLRSIELSHHCGQRSGRQSQGNATMPAPAGTTRLTVNIGQATHDALNRYMEREGATQTEALRRWPPSAISSIRQPRWMVSTS